MGLLLYLVLLGVGVLAGSVAAVSGFGIGSLLTPVLALQVGTGIWTHLLILTFAVVIGTVVGQHIRGRVSQALFRRVITFLLLALGASMLVSGGSGT